MGKSKIKIQEMASREYRVPSEASVEARAKEMSVIGARGEERLYRATEKGRSEKEREIQRWRHACA